MKKLFKRVLSKLGFKSPGFIFISDSEDCPCLKTYELIKNDSKINSVLFLNTNSDEAYSKIVEMSRFKNLVVFMHGDNVQKKFFYLHFSPEHNRNFNALIKDEWMSVFEKKERIIYFHVCNGADILQMNKVIQPLLKSWVAHDKTMYGFNSRDEKIRFIRKKFLKEMYNRITDRASPQSLKSAILATYYELLGDLQDLSNEHTPNNCYKDYVTNIIVTIGKNIESLSTSQT